MTVVLIDDTRTFKDGRDHVAFRRAEDAVSFLTALPAVKEVWLDFVLAGGEAITDVLFPLIRGKRAGGAVAQPERVVYHSSSSSGYSLVAALCADLGWPKPERVFPETALEEVRP